MEKLLTLLWSIDNSWDNVCIKEHTFIIQENILYSIFLEKPFSMKKLEQKKTKNPVILKSYHYNALLHAHTKYRWKEIEVDIFLLPTLKCNSL